MQKIVCMYTLQAGTLTTAGYPIVATTANLIGLTLSEQVCIHRIQGHTTICTYMSEVTSWISVLCV